MEITPLDIATVQVMVTTATVILRYLNRIVSIRKLELCVVSVTYQE